MGTNTSFDLNEAGKSIDTARQSGKYAFSALMDACSQEYIDLTKDVPTSCSDQESDEPSDSEESEEEELLTRGDTGYSLRNVERVHWGATTIHEIPEVKSAFISADENSECEDDKKITKKPKVSRENKLIVLQKRAKKSRSGRKIKTPNRLADMEMVGTVYK